MTSVAIARSPFGFRSVRASASWLMGGLVVSMMVAGCDKAPVEEPREIAHNVRVLELRTSTLAEFHEIAGPVAPVRGADLAAEESGTVVRIGADKGARVKAGQVLVEQERSILLAEKTAAAAALRTQEFNLDKTRQLHAAGKVSDFDLLLAESAQAQASATAGISARRWQRAAVSAPFDGVVAERYVELGSMATAGQRVARVIDPYRLKLESYVTDTEVEWVRVGDVAEVVLGEAAVRAMGIVTWVGPEADLRTGKFPVEIAIDNPDLVLRSGVIGRAKLPKHTVDNAVIVPRDALLPGKNGNRVYVVDDDRAVLRQVTLGEDQGMMVVVREGLEAGERLIVRGQRDLVEGSLVVVTETTSAADGTMPDDPDVVRSKGSLTRMATDDSTEAAR